MKTLSARDIIRFWAKVDKRGVSDCWPWLGRIDAKGSHLRAGTQLENIADRESKGRGSRVSGDAHHLAKLSAAQIPAIRALYPSLTLAELGRRHGVSYRAIQSVITGRTWAHIKGDR